jgi:ribosomal protein S1
MNLNKEKRKMRLSIKRATPNPWNLFVQKHKEGDLVSGKVVKKVKGGYIVEIDEIEAFLPNSQTNEPKTIGTDITVTILKIESENEIYKITISENKKEEIEQIKKLKKEAESERVVSLERKVKNADSVDSREE